MTTRVRYGWLLAAACGLAQLGCSGEPAEGGADVVVQALAAADVARVTLTITGDGITAPIVNDLMLVGSQWVGRVNAIPAGTGRTFAAAAFAGAGTLLYQGQAVVDVGAGERAVVAIRAQQAAAPTPFANTAPENVSLVASRAEVAPGDRIALVATARDPDPGDTLTWAWTSAGGAFTAAATPATDWVAPLVEGMDTLRITVTDSHGAAASMELRVLVTARAGRGSANVTVTLNTAPEVANAQAMPARIDAGETTALDVVATDADGDALANAWSTACAGSFSAPAARMTTFTLAALPAGGACAFHVAVTDGRGGANAGEITVAAGPGPAPNLAPQITSAYQSVDMALGDQQVRFEIQAYDPDGTPLTFAWAADQGTIEWTAASGGTGYMRWRAPPCFAPGASARIDAIVTDGSGVSTTEPFTVTSGASAPCCAAPPPDLVAWWRGEGDATDAAGANHGTLAGDAGFAPGRVGSALSFDGAGDVTIPDAPALRAAGQLTIELWANFASVPRGGPFAAPSLVAQTDTVFAGYVLYWRSDLESLELDLADNCDGYLHLGAYAPVPGLAAGAWRHIAVTGVDGGPAGPQFRFYVDGEEVPSVPAVDPPHAGCGWYASSSVPVHLGYRPGVPWAPFSGLLDEVSLYRRALAPAEIRAIYQAGAAGKCP